MFERLAGRYDAWYEGPAGARCFPPKWRACGPLLAGLPRPWLEVGVGSGRFAEALGAGLDPAAAPLAIARSRGIGVTTPRGCM